MAICTSKTQSLMIKSESQGRHFSAHEYLKAMAKRGISSSYCISEVQDVKLKY